MAGTSQKAPAGRRSGPGIKKPGKGKLIWQAAAVIAVIALSAVLLYNRELALLESISGGDPAVQKSVRKPVFAGTWYPEDPQELSSVLEHFYSLSEKRQLDGRIAALLVPHAGYAYSGKVASEAFSQLEPGDYDTVIIIGPSHRHSLEGASILNVSHYSTPLGAVPLSPKRFALLESGVFETVPEAHSGEHSIEVELPFLQHSLEAFSIIPILVGPVDFLEFSKQIMKLLDERTLVVVSADLSHYHSYGEAVMLDSACLEGITSLNISSLNSCEIDAPWAVASLMYIAQQQEWLPVQLSYANSGDTSGEKSSVVGYSAIAFIEEEGLNFRARELLLELSREALLRYYSTGEVPVLNEQMLAPSLLEKKGCFVTLEKNGSLRGCIGHILPVEPLYKCVLENTYNAAMNDARFSPVEEHELDGITIELSILSEPERLEYSSGEDLLEKIRPFTDGVILRSGMKQSTYLPSVWKQMPGKEEFLSSLCRKGGMEPGCWQHPESTEVQVYTAQVFSETEH